MGVILQHLPYPVFWGAIYDLLWFGRVKTSRNGSIQCFGFCKLSYNTYLALAMVQLNRQVRGSPKMMSSSKKVLRRNMKRRRQTISPEQFNKWPHTDPERFSLNALYGKDILPSKISNEFSVRSTSEKELCFHLT